MGHPDVLPLLVVMQLVPPHLPQAALPRLPLQQRHIYECMQQTPCVACLLQSRVQAFRQCTCSFNAQILEMPGMKDCDVSLWGLQVELCLRTCKHQSTWCIHVWHCAVCTILFYEHMFCQLCGHKA